MTDRKEDTAGGSMTLGSGRGLGALFRAFLPPFVRRFGGEGFLRTKQTLGGAQA